MILYSFWFIIQFSHLYSFNNLNHITSSNILCIYKKDEDLLSHFYTLHCFYFRVWYSYLILQDLTPRRIARYFFLLFFQEHWSTKKFISHILYLWNYMLHYPKCWGWYFSFPHVCYIATQKKIGRFYHFHKQKNHGFTSCRNVKSFKYRASEPSLLLHVIFKFIEAEK